ncbi:MAG: hypothetical protein JF616_03030 [Fibrobacteres bacterium]|jgi:hypothetical protein|nr:hypothetical protein [Fibrobacterota bacterium]
MGLIALKYMNSRELVKGIATRFPYLREIVQRREGTGGSDSARYCYSVWLRHLSLAHAAGCDAYPKVIAELGPGDSLGLGLAGLLSGSERYFALDVVRFANFTRNLRIFDELVELLRKREPIPGPDEFPSVRPTLSSYAFPAFLDADRLGQALAPARVASLRKELEGDGSNPKGRIAYFAPWDRPEVLQRASVDMVFSQAVLEHVEGLSGTYRALAMWLKPDGFMSHTIDFKAHHTSRIWNGHWAYPELLWSLIKGKRIFLLNRKPRSAHIQLLNDVGFEVIHESKSVREDGLKIDQLAGAFKALSPEDATTAGTFLLARPQQAVAMAVG